MKMFNDEVKRLVRMLRDEVTAHDYDSAIVYIADDVATITCYDEDGASMSWKADDHGVE